MVVILAYVDQWYNWSTGGNDWGNVRIPYVFAHYNQNNWYYYSNLYTVQSWQQLRKELFERCIYGIKKLLGI